MIAKEAVAAKSVEFERYVDQLKQLTVKAIEEQTPLHEVEEQAFRVLLELGRATLQVLLDVLGPGDVGPSCSLPEGRTVGRLDELHSRRYLSIFGEFQLERYVYGRGEGRKIEMIPLDARLALPESKFSYLLQDWDQSLAVEEPFAEVSDVIRRILGLQQHVDSLERMNRDMSETVSDFQAVQTAPPPDEEGEIVVQTADCKGVPIRRPADAPVIDDHRSKSGPKPDRKKMATLASVYTINPHVRTPEEVVESLFRRPSEPRPKTDRPRPQHKRVRACLNHETAEGDVIRAAPAMFGWMGTSHRLRGKKQTQLATICNYFEKNQHRMRYDEYLARGYPIASGVIEGACRHVVKDRLERTGMTWTIDGAQAMLQLRCIHLSEDWHEYMTFRVQKETERLYPYRESLPEQAWALAM